MDVNRVNMFYVVRGISMLKKIRTITKQKGQGIVEFAILLAFVVGIGMMANFSGEVQARFNKVLDLVGGKKDYTYAIENYSKLPKDKLQEVDEAIRILMDQEALANIGRFFIGHDNEFVKKYLLGNGYPDNACLLHYGEVVDENGNVKSYLYYNKDDKNTRSNKNDEIAKTSDVIHWMRGDFGLYDETSNAIVPDSYATASYSSDNRYLFSNYPVNRDTKDAGNGVKITLKYDAKGKVSEAIIKVNPLAGNPTKPLAVTVDKDKNYTPTNS